MGLIKLFTLAAAGLAIASPLASAAPAVPETAVTTIQKRVGLLAYGSKLMLTHAPILWDLNPRDFHL